jgi:hypothetical protein
VDLGFEILDVVNSVRALASGDPVLEAPLPSPCPSLGFTLEIPLTSGEDSQAAPPLALCVAPASPSLTGGWALDAAEHDDMQAQEPPADVYEAALERFYSQRDSASRPTATIEISHVDQSQPLVRRRAATACLVEIDLDFCRCRGTESAVQGCWLSWRPSTRHGFGRTLTWDVSSCSSSPTQDAVVDCGYGSMQTSKSAGLTSDP